MWQSEPDLRSVLRGLAYMDVETKCHRTGAGGNPTQRSRATDCGWVHFAEQQRPPCRFGYDGPIVYEANRNAIASDRADTDFDSAIPWRGKDCLIDERAHE